MEFKLELEADFYGVDTTTFKLDKYIFEVVENPSDGYRSSMQEIRMKDDTTGLIFFQTPLAKIRVENRTDGRRGDINCFNGYNLVDVKDGFVWLTFGTDESDSYYPQFEFFYQHKYEWVLNKLEE